MTLVLILLISEGLRRYTKHQLNTHLQGYTVVASWQAIPAPLVVFSGAGGIEYTPRLKVPHVRTATIRGLLMDYIYFGQTTNGGRGTAG
jgi:hypothetical protein